jgi:hypothetical protein
MGRYYRGFGYIDLENKDEYYKVVGQLKKYHVDIENLDDDLNFEMSGHNVIDYSCLEEIKKWAIKNKIKMEISVVEYVEVEDVGFYYSSEEDENGS